MIDPRERGWMVALQDPNVKAAMVGIIQNVMRKRTRDLTGTPADKLGWAGGRVQGAHDVLEEIERLSGEHRDKAA